MKLVSSDIHAFHPHFSMTEWNLSLGLQVCILKLTKQFFKTLDICYLCPGPYTLKTFKTLLLFARLKRITQTTPGTVLMLERTFS